MNAGRHDAGQHLVPRQNSRTNQDKSGGFGVFEKNLSAIIVGMIALSLCACGGGGGDDEDDEDEGPEDASGAGIWSGTYRLDGQTASIAMFGLVTEEADFVLVAAGNASRLPRVLFGTGTTNGNAFSANALSYQGPNKAPTSLSGTIADRSSINGSYSLTGESASFTLSYSATYDRGASLATLAGIYTTSFPATPTSPATTLTVDVGATGAFSYTNSASGCTITGSFTVPHNNRNYYRWTGTAAGCTAGDGAMSGVAYLGDNTSGQNRTLTQLGQNQAQTAALIVVTSK